MVDLQAKTNGYAPQKCAGASRADEVSYLLKAVQRLIVPFIGSARGQAVLSKQQQHHQHHQQLLLSCKGCLHDTGGNGGDCGDVTGLLRAGQHGTLVDAHSPAELKQLLDLNLPTIGLRQAGFLKQVQQILKYSVNTWDSGFMSKLYGSTDAPGLAAELVLASLNTQVHTYEVSPALTMVEKHTTRALAAMFGLTGAHAGGISVQGGAASNTTSMVIARNVLHPRTKTHGSQADGLKLVLFTSAQGHYSIQKAAMMLGLGTDSVWAVPVDPGTKRMDPIALADLVLQAKREGYTPFYVNATAGTTVFGSYDPLEPIAEICKAHEMWLHVDASWGGPVIFSSRHKHKLNGSSRADSIAINPHKMLGVPVTCSFLLGADMRKFHRSNTLPASYLFHHWDEGAGDEEIYDLADLTLQCGRKGDSLKFYLSWVYHGTEGYATQVDTAMDTALYLTKLVAEHDDLVLVSENPPPCCQVCFYYAKSGALTHRSADQTTAVTKHIVKSLIPMGFLIDYASGDNRGYFMRPVMGRNTGRAMALALVKSVVELGEQLWEASLSRSQEAWQGWTNPQHEELTCAPRISISVAE